MLSGCTPQQQDFSHSGGATASSLTVASEKDPLLPLPPIYSTGDLDPGAPPRYKPLPLQEVQPYPEDISIPPPPPQQQSKLRSGLLVLNTCLLPPQDLQEAQVEVSIICILGGTQLKSLDDLSQRHYRDVEKHE